MSIRPEEWPDFIEFIVQRLRFQSTVVFRVTWPKDTTETFFLPFGCLEGQRSRVDAVALAGEARPVIEKMNQMGFAARTRLQNRMGTILTLSFKIHCDVASADWTLSL